MTMLINEATYFTADFAKLSNARKIEELVQQLNKIAFYSDLDSTEEFEAVVEMLNAMRVKVK